MSTDDVRAEINPDGVPIDVDWGRLVIGASVFIPALNLRKLNVQMNRAASSRRMRLTSAERIENGYYGARFWRIA